MSDPAVTVVPTPATDVVDAWVDDKFAPLDTRPGLVDELIALAEEEPELAPDLQPEVISNTSAAEPVAAAPAEDQPETIEFEDGSSALIEHTSKGWQATLDTGAGGGKEVFKGATKNDLLINVLGAKVAATKTIREQNRERKRSKLLGDTPVAPAPTATAEPVLHELTADEVFEIKTKLESNPGLAFDTYFQKRTGLTVDELVSLAKKGASASDELTAEAVAKEFTANHPDYAPYIENYESLVGFLAKKFLKQTLTPSEFNSDHSKISKQGNVVRLETELFRKGFWTAENLDEAYEELSEAGLLLSPEASEEPEQTAPAASAAPVRVVTPPAQPAAPATDGRIVREVRRPRAGLGIRPSETTARVQTSAKPPSDEDYDNMTDEQIAKLYAGVRQLAAQTRR